MTDDGQTIAMPIVPVRAKTIARVRRTHSEALELYVAERGRVEVSVATLTPWGWWGPV